MSLENNSSFNESNYPQNVSPILPHLRDGVLSSRATCWGLLKFPQELFGFLSGLYHSSEFHVLEFLWVVYMVQYGNSEVWEMAFLHGYATVMLHVWTHCVGTAVHCQYHC